MSEYDPKFLEEMERYFERNYNHSQLEDEDPVKPGFVREYEFLHGYQDVPREEALKRAWADRNDPLLKILREAIDEELRKEVIKTILSPKERFD